MKCDGEKKLYCYIRDNGPVSENRVRGFVSGNTDCVGALDKLIRNGYIEEKEGLFAITGKEFRDCEQDE